MVKIALWFGGLIAIVGIGAWLWFGGMLDPLLSEVGLRGSAMQEESLPQTAEQEEVGSELTTGNNTSDQALEDDLSVLDAQLEAYAETSATIDQSLEDEPVPQEY